MKQDLDWNAFVEEVGPKLYSYFSARFGQHDASDLTQEALIRLVRKIQNGAFDPRKGNHRMYVFGIAHFVALEARKSINNNRETEESNIEVDPPSDIESQLIHNQNAETVRRMITALPDIQQQILSLLVDRDMTLENISRLLGLPIGTVKSHVHRAKAKIIDLIHKHGG